MKYYKKKEFLRTTEKMATFVPESYFKQQHVLLFYFLHHYLYTYKVFNYGHIVY